MSVHMLDESNERSNLATLTLGRSMGPVTNMHFWILFNHSRIDLGYPQGSL